MSDKFSDADIVDSWTKNVEPWVRAVQNKELESRRLVTDRAVLDILSRIPAKNALDIGCGEGWLARELVARGVEVTGIDVVAELVAQAKLLGAGLFKTLAYEDLSAATLGATYDVAVCNFSLLGEASVEHVFSAVPLLLNEGGSFVVQTLHPLSACGELPYTDGWREGSWAGFSDEFCDPAPWYFRTVESWLALFRDNGLMVDVMDAPLNPKTGQPASLIMLGRALV